MKEYIIVTDRRAVTVAGTEERLSESVSKTGCKVKAVIIRANTGNSNVIYVVGPLQRATTTTDGYILSPGETVTLDVSQFHNAYIDLEHIWIDALVSGDGVGYIAFEVQ